MPNEFDTNKNQLDLFSYAESKQNQQDKRQKLASSGFTATVWTLSGVVLAACSLFEDDEGLGGESVSVLASPVHNARLYFDINGDGVVDEEDVRIQNEQHPGGFITNRDGLATGIPLELHGRPYIADLNGARDAITGQILEGQYPSLQDEDGNHLVASPITALIAEAMADQNQPGTVQDVIAAFTPSGVDATELLEEIRTPISYFLGGSQRVIALSKYLADNQAREIVGRGDTIAEQIAEAQRIIGEVESGLDPASTDAIVVLNEDTDGAAGVQVQMDIGEHDSYVGIINAFAQDGRQLTYTLVNTDGTEYDTDADGAYTINARGGISVTDGTVTPTNADMTTFNVVISDGNGNEETVEVTIMVDVDVYELSLEEGREVGDIDENILGSDADPLIAGIEVDDATVNMPDYFTIRDNALGIFADKFEMMEDSINGGWNIKLKDTEYLDYEAIPGGEFELYVSVRNDATADMGEHSNILTVTITVNDDPDDISFSGDTRADLREDDTTPPSTHLIAEGQVQIANQVDANGVRAQVMLNSDPAQSGVQTLPLTHGTFTYNHETNTWTYTVDNTAAAIQALLDGQATTDIVTLTIDGGNGITHTQSIVLNVHGANEDVHFVDANDARTAAASVGVERGNPVLAGVDIFDGLTLNNANLADIQVDFAETGGDYNLFTITDDGLLTFTGTNADVAGFGSSIPLNLEITAPTLTTATLRFALTVNVINEVDDGRAEYEVTGDVDVGQTLTVSRVQGSDDPDGIVGAVSFQWFRGDQGTPAFTLLGTGDTYIVTQTDIDSSESIGVFVRYTDGSGVTYTHTDGDPATTIAAFASPVSFTSPAIADRTINLDEDTTGSTVHFAVRAESEDDAGAPVGIANYMLLDANNAPTTTYRGFTIDTTSGDITLTGSLDYEDTTADGTRIILRVRATDMNSPAETATLTLTVNVGDVNDNAPVFDPNQVTMVAIDETLGNGQSVGLSVSATDADGTTANSTVTYSVTGGTGMGIFDVDSSSGVITVLDASMIDYESGTTSYTLIIGASDGLDASGTDDPTFTPDTTTTITINISDVNDESPSVPNPVATGSARITSAVDNPSSGPGTGMGYTVTVSDADADASTLDVRVTTGDPRFEFVRQTGTNTWELYLIAGQEIALSELNNQLSFEYIVTDSGVGTTSVTGSFVLTVVDTPVEFTSPSVTTIPLDENNVANLAVATVTATSEDTDGNDVYIQSFTLVNDFGGLFSISTSDLGTASAEASITIASANALDFETTESYTLRVVATDTEGEDNTLTLTINVGNEEEGDASYEVRLTDSNGQSVTDLAIGTILTPTVTTADPDIIDTNSIRYQWFIGTNDPANYIQGARGQAETLTLQSGDDLTATYGVAITYTDGADNTETVEALTSSVSFDANFARSGILEETHSGGTLSYSANAEVTTATDTIAVSATSVTPGSPTITYDFASGGNPNNYFAIGANGAITWARETTFDFETLSEAERTLEIVVIATEVENSGSTNAGTGDTARVSIILTIQNEQEGDGTYIVRGNVAAGAELTAEVNDPDGTRSVTYEWYSINPANNARTVLGTTQSITLPEAPNFDDSLTYHVDIVHIDNLGDRHEETLDASAVQFNIQKTLTDNTAFPDSIAENTDSLPVVVASLDGDTRTATYTFVGGDTITTSGVFTISQSGSTAGAITVNAPSDINFETAQEFNDGSRGYTLNVRATFAEDTANNLPEVTGDVVVTIIVTDVNEHAPVFVTNADDNTLSTGTDEIAEDAANGTRVGLFRATDADGSNNDVTYSLDDGGLGVFGIREVTGTNNWEIYVLDNTRLDFESATKSYTIEITATDSDPDTTTRKSSGAEAFTINITDVNDNDPVLSATPVWEGTLDFGVPENTGTNVHLFTVSATDADENPSLTYEIVSIDGVALASIANPIFGIDASDGRVGLAGQLDRETKASHEIVIRAVDEGGRASNEETFTVTVGDVNDNKPVLGEPVWASDYGDNGVPEDAYTGAPLQIFTATATDRDANNGFSYEIVSVDGVTYDSSTSIFSIHAASGRVGITSALDYETAPEIMDDTNTVIGRGHEIVIVAIDNSGTGMRSEPGTITVLVANRDDGPAVFEVSPTQANKDILEVEVDTADPDGLDGTYSYQWFTTTDDGVTQTDITNENGRRFDTSGRSDPAGTVIGVRVEYTDNAGTRYTKDGAGDDEVAPFAVNTTLRFTSSYSIMLDENDASPTLPTFALELNGVAVTGATYTFATNGNPGDFFALSSAGVLTLSSTYATSGVDFEAITDAQKSFRLLIMAEATSGETAVAPVTVTINDVNDIVPVLSQSGTATPIAENDPGANTGITFTVADDDTVNTITYNVAATTSNTNNDAIAALFEVDEASGMLRLAGNNVLDREHDALKASGQISLTITAHDGVRNSNSETVTITVNDVNDFDPVFRNGAEHTETISENLFTAGSTVVVSANPARDGDATADNRDLTYSIVSVSGSGSGLFNLTDPKTGRIVLTQALDYETAPLLPGGTTNRGYVIELLVVDQDGGQDTQTLTVVVTDEDDTDPAFGTLDWGSVGTGTAGATTRTIDENTTGTLLTIPISDVDTAGGTLAVRIVSGNSVEGGEDLFVFAKNTANTAAELSINPNRVLNYEDGTTHTLVLEVSDGTRTATQTVTINVNNINEETPTFTNNPIVTWETGFELGIIPETTDVSGGRVLVGRVAISDDDGATNFLGDRTFAINGAGTKFEIERNTDTATNGGTLGEGLIYLNAALDREGVGADDAEYDAVKITVTDGSLPAVTSDAFSIFIDDVNEGDPVIAVTGSPASFTERTASGNEATGVTFTISDADTGSTYTSSEIALSGDSRFDFVWDEAMQSGTVVLKDTETLDYETAADRAITLTLTVTDPLDASVTDTETITINVGNADDVASELGTLTWQAGTGSGVTGEEHIRTINEDQGASPILVIPVSDPDTATASLTPTIQGGSPVDASNNPIFSFGILNNQAILSVLSSRLDYETAPNTYTLVLEVSDGTNTPAATQTVTINVGNVNEHGPAFGADLVDFETGFANGIVPENTAEGTVIGVVDVSDADGDVLTVTVLPDQGATQALADKFEVVYNMMDDQYELKLKTALDLEGATPDPSSAFGLRLRATDGTNSVDSPADTGSLIVISIGNVDDADPVFNDTHIDWNTAALNIRGVDSNTIAVFEYVVDGTTTSGAPAGRKLADLAASDPDTSGALAYSIDNGPQIGGVDIFEIGGANNDELLLKTALDYEAAEDLGGGNRGYTLTLTVSDGRMGVNPVSHEVTIRVLNADEGRAVFAPLTSDGDVTAPAVGDELTFTPTPTTADPDGNPVAPNTFTRTWYRENPDGSGLDTITNASDTYTITSADVGKIVGVIVNYTDGGGTEYLGTAGVRVKLADVVASDFNVTGGTSGMADQYDASAVDATGTLMFGTASGMMVNDAGTYTIVTDGTYGTAEVVDGVWTYNVDNTNATIKALASGATQKDTFTIGVPLTAAAGGGVQNVDVTVTITGRTDSQVMGGDGAQVGRAIADNSDPNYPGNPLDRAASTTFDVIQGGNTKDEIYSGSGGSLIFGGYGSDDIYLGSGADTVVHRFSSREGLGYINDGGAITINNFQRNKDKLVLVDAGTKMEPDPDDPSQMIEVPNPITRATFLDETKSGFAPATGLVQLKPIFKAVTGELQGIVIEINGGSKDDGPDGVSAVRTGVQVTILYDQEYEILNTDGTIADQTNADTFLGTDIPGAHATFGVYDVTETRLTDYVILPNYFGDTDEFFDVIALDDLDIDIL